MQLNYEFIKSQSRVERLLGELMEKPAWGVDTETTGSDSHTDKVTMLQIGRHDKQYILDTRKVDPRPLKPFFESRDVKKICHFAVFDYMMMKGSFGIEMEQLRCTWVGEKILTMGKKFSGFSLEAMLYDRLNVKEVDKTVRESFIKMNWNQEFTKEQIEYGARDVAYLNDLARSVIKDIQRDQLDATFLLECQFIPCLGDMQHNGIKLDKEHWRSLKEENENELQKVENQLDEIAGIYFEKDLFGKPAINYGSPEQVLQLFERLRIKGQVWDPDKKKEITKEFRYFPVSERKEKENIDKYIMSSSDEALKCIKRDYPVVKLIKKWRSLSVLINTFGEPYINAIHPKTGRIQTSFNQLGTETGRLSKGKESPINLLNLPGDKRFRHGFIAENGCLVETDDYSGCELRILAELSEDPKFLNAFQTGEDPHCMVASDLYGVTVTKENEYAPYRRPAKNLNFGIAYGMGPTKLYNDLNALGFSVTREEASSLYKDYCKKFKPAVDFLRESGKQAFKQGYLVNLNGRRRYWIKPEKDSPKYYAHKAAIEREGGNFMIQSVNADIVKYAMVLMRDEKKNKGFQTNFINQVYDEVVTETTKEDSPNFHPIKQEIMKKAGKRWLKTVPVEVEGEVLPYWTK